MKVTGFNANHCPVEVTLAVIGGKWKPLILWHLGEGGVRRFLELQRMIPGITRKMLTQHLASSSGMVSSPEKCSVRCRCGSSTRSRNTARLCARYCERFVIGVRATKRTWRRMAKELRRES